MSAETMTAPRGERRSVQQISENEACYRVMMIARRHPSVWVRLFSEREAGLTWGQILAGIQDRSNRSDPDFKC